MSRQENNPQNEQHHEFPPVGLSFFGVEWKTLQSTYRFNNNQLVQAHLLTRTQSEKLSRMSNSSDLVASSFNQNKGKGPTFIDSISRAGAKYIMGNRNISSESLIPLADTFKSNLMTAAEKDIFFVNATFPLAVRVGVRAAEIIGITVPQLLVDLNTQQNPLVEEFIQSIKVDNQLR